MSPMSAQAAALIKGTSPAVYYVDGGKRWVFPNEKIYFSWYADFSQVQTITDAQLASYPIGGNVTYKPGFRLVKVQTDPKVYAVGPGGSLRWLTSEDAARAVYGADWSKRVDDVSDAFFFDYRQGDPITTADDLERVGAGTVASISDDLAVRDRTTVTTQPSNDVSSFTARKSGAWSEQAVWGGKAPTAGARVVIPADVNVTYDLAESPDLASLDVQGTLAFRPNASTRLSAKQIVVRGALTAGTADAPLAADARAEILLTGSTPGEDGLTVDGGALSLHGDEVGEAWTRLAAPARENATDITLESPVPWPVGGEVAVLGATAADAPEIRKIVAVDGAKLTLDAPLTYAHRAEDGLRSEVALVTRNVVVSGLGGGAGSYVRAINRARIDLTDVELYKLGRKGVEGQYPLLLDGLAGGSVKRSVIRASGNRCVVLRQTNDAVLEDDVAIDAYGHCFATADGAETGNVFSGDLAAAIHPGAMAEDAVPAAFFIKNPANALSGDAAVGSEGFGYWYDLPESAALDDGTVLKPRQTALGTFNGNLARGNRKTGLYVDDDDKGLLNYAPEQKAVFSGLSAIMNGERGFWIRGSNIEVSGAFLAENPVGGTFAAFGATFKDSKVAGRLEGSESPGPARYGFTYYDGPVSVQGVDFSHFTAGAAALGFEEKDPVLPDPRNSLRDVVFMDARAWHLADPVTPGDAMAVVRDFDAGGSVGAKSDFLGPHCAPERDADAYRCADVYAQALVALRDARGDQDVTFTNLDTGADVTLSPGPSFDGQYAYANVAEGGSYRVAVPGANPVRVAYDGLTDPLRLRLPATAAAQVKSDGLAVEKKDLADLAPGAWAYDAAKGEVALWLEPGEDVEISR